MHNFLTKDITFTEYPPATKHHKGIPIITFEGILQGISTRLILYDLALAGTFNNHAISTLGIENFFLLYQKQFYNDWMPKSSSNPPNYSYYNGIQHSKTQL